MTYKIRHPVGLCHLVTSDGECFSMGEIITVIIIACVFVSVFSLNLFVSEAKREFGETHKQ